MSDDILPAELRRGYFQTVPFRLYHYVVREIKFGGKQCRF